MHTTHFSKVASVHVVVEGIELGVVESVKAFGAQLEVSAFRDGEILVDVGAKVGAARSNNDVSARIAEAQVRAAIPSRNWR